MVEISIPLILDLLQSKPVNKPNSTTFVHRILYLDLRFVGDRVRVSRDVSKRTSLTIQVLKCRPLNTDSVDTETLFLSRNHEISNFVYEIFFEIFLTEVPGVSSVRDFVLVCTDGGLTSCEPTRQVRTV